MPQYINKDALVAEIEKLKADILQKKSQCKRKGLERIMHQIGAYNKVISIINTLEVKEVDLDSNIRAYLTNYFNVYEDGVLQSKKSSHPLSTYDIIKVAKHFFELGMAVRNKAQKGE